MNFVQEKNLLVSAVQIMHLSSVRYLNYSQNYSHEVSNLQLMTYFDLKKLVLQLLNCEADFDH